MKNAKLAPVCCKTPKFKGKRVINDIVTELDASGNRLLFIKSVLDEESLSAYIDEAVRMERSQGMTLFGPKPREEICYSADGKPYNYSRVSHITVSYPTHVLKILPTLMANILRIQPENPYQELSHGVDILYSDKILRGGSISAHSDDELPWGLVIIFSVGQTRWLRVRRKLDGEYFNVPLLHNSIVAMYGETFQLSYTHQVDKLSPNEPIGQRLSINIRYLRKTTGNIVGSGRKRKQQDTESPNLR